ncbi:MAG: hypothetical protein AAF320_03440, partial [Myxococcota bacterium]
MSYLDSAIVVAYLLITLAIGVWSGRHVSTMKDFCIGDRKMSTTALVIAMFATLAGGGDTIGLTEKIVKFGLAYVFVYASAHVFYFLVMWLIAPRMGKAMEKAISPGDFAKYFYGTPGKIITGLSVVFFYSAILGIQVKSFSYLFGYFFDFSQTQACLLACFIFVFYSSIGGIKSVNSTDIFQFGTMFIALPALCYVGLQSIGGYDAIKMSVPVEHLQIIPRR